MSKNKSRSIKYKKAFNSWKRNCLESKNYTVYSSPQKKGGKILSHTFTQKELLSLTQCYTTSKRVKFSKARRQLRKHWFISEKGTLISFRTKNMEPVLIVPTPSGTGTNMREQYDIRFPKKKIKRYCADPSTLVALTFGGKASIQAEKILNRYGLLALKKVKHKPSMVELHHERPYKHATTKSGLRKNRPYNCNIEHIKFLTHLEHQDALTNAPKPGATKQEEFEYMKKIQASLSDGQLNLILPDGNKAGQLVENPEVHLGNDGKTVMSYEGKNIIIEKVAAALMSVSDATPALFFESGEKVTPAEDCAQACYDLLLEEFTQRYSGIAVSNKIYLVGHIEDEPIYGGYAYS